MAYIPTRLLNLCLRGVTLLSKFALVFVLAKFLEPAEVGLYGLLAASVGFGLFALGLEFYTYAMRELIASPENLRKNILSNQLIFYGLIYIFFLPTFVAIFFADFLPWILFFWFYVLLILEHVAQELNRILIGLSLQLEASFVLFIRSGAWGVVLIPIFWLYPNMRNLDVVLIAWSFGAFVACILGVIYVVRNIEMGSRFFVDWAWIKRGLQVAFPMLLAAFAVRGLFTFDRYWVEALGGLETLGAYVLYAGIGTAIISFLDAGVVVFFYPRLVSAARSMSFPEFMSSMKILHLNIILATSVLTALAYTASLFIVEWLDRPVYADNFHLIKWLLLGMFIYGISHTPHLGLYAQGRDRTLLFSQIGALLTFVLVAASLQANLGITAIPIALCVAFFVLWLWKFVAYNKMLAELNLSVQSKI